MATWLQRITDDIDAQNSYRANFMARLGTPNNVIATPDCDPDFPQEYGYWRIPGGILRFTRNGMSCWMWDSQLFIRETEIDVLVALKKKAPKEIDKAED